jgi:hypothetical protein
MKMLAVHRAVLGMLVAVTCAMSTAQGSIAVSGSDLNGTRSSNANGLTATGIWDETPFISITWRISFNTTTNLWDYFYDVTRTGQGGISHWILELTQFLDDGTSLETYWDGVFASNTVVDDVGTFTPPDPSNPNLPGSIFGVKVDDDADLSFSTSHAPVWGNFYAKDGNAGGQGENSAWNTGFNVAPGDTGPYTNWVARPNGPPPPITQDPLPEPATVVMWIGLAGAFAYGAKKRKNAAA